MKITRILGWWVVGLVIPIAVVADTPVPNSGTVVNVDHLDHAIDEVLADDEYAWRLEARQDRDEELPPWLIRFFEESGDAIVSAFDFFAELADKVQAWLRELTGGSEVDPQRSTRGSSTAVSWILLILAFGTVCSLLLILIRRSRKAVKAEEIEAQPIELSRLAHDESTADEVEPHRWRKWALELAEEGRLREAIRAAHLATLSALAHAELIHLRRFRSNLEYLREVRRRARARPQLADFFSANIQLFERIWYGRDLPDQEAFTSSLTNLDRISADVTHA